MQPQIELHAVALLLTLGLLPVLAALQRTRFRLRAASGVCVLLAFYAAIVGLATMYQRPRAAAAQPPPYRPIEVGGEGYVSSSACKSCHPAQYDSWHSSYHRRMTQVVSTKTVAAPLAEEPFEVAGESYRVFARAEEVWCEFRDPHTGERESKRLAVSTGSHHLQAYWLSAGRSRALRLFPLTWNIEREEWIPIDSVFIYPPERKHEVLQAHWNSACSHCHTTREKPRVRPDGSADTIVSEFGISCEACHGPGEAHVQANIDPRRRFSLHSSDDPDPTIVQPQRLPPQRAAQVCGQCHGALEFRNAEDHMRWIAMGFAYEPGDDLLATSPLIPKGDTLYWRDGQVRVSGREFNALLASPCYAHGDESRGIMTCTSCHLLHPGEDDERPLDVWANDQLKPEIDTNQPGSQTNAACTGCHQEYATEKSLVAHSFHEASSSGSQCMNCHMPHTSWGLIKAMRSHEIGVPSARETTEVGRPNACNLCHLDKSLGWVADHLQQRYAQVPPELSGDEQTVALSLLHALRGDAGQRALAAWSMGWEPARQAAGASWMAPALTTLLEDPYAVVRTTAAHSLATLAGFEAFEFDFVGDPRGWRAARERAFAIWEQQERSGSANPAILLDGNGRLDHDLHDRLVGERDDREVLLGE